MVREHLQWVWGRNHHGSRRPGNQSGTLRAAIGHRGAALLPRATQTHRWTDHRSVWGTAQPPPPRGQPHRFVPPVRLTASGRLWEDRVHSVAERATQTLSV